MALNASTLNYASTCGGVQSSSQWSPYMDNKGTVVAVAGADFVVLGGDTRVSYGFSIPTRNFSKYTKLTEKCAIITSGMQAEIVTLHRLLKIYVAEYEHTHQASPSLNALQQLLSTVLYQKRFFPFYTFNVLTGLHEDGTTSVYTYDAVGSTKGEKYGAAGTGSEFAVSILDEQMTSQNQAIDKKPLEKLEMIDMIKDIFTVIAERDIFTGDAIDLIVIDSTGFHTSKMPLRGD